MASFCKHTNCPSSEKLLAFQRGEISFREVEKIKQHLRGCEFCASEVEFYSHYPQAEEAITTCEIPSPLYELAEALLSNKHKDFLALNKLLCESEVTM